MHSSYWHKTLLHSVGRRRLLAGTGAGALGAAFLAACGGGNDGADSGGDSSALVTKAQDTSKDAKRGGVLRLSNDTEPPHFDPHALTAAISGYTQMMYSRLLQIKVLTDLTNP
jgi:hypothetical protein